MKFYGYTLDNNSEMPEALSEVSIECTLDEIDDLVELLISERNEMANWAKNNKQPQNIQYGDFHEIQAKETENGNRLIFLVDLHDAIKAKEKTEDEPLFE